MTTVRLILCVALTLGLTPAAGAASEPMGLRFVASYQGLLSAGATLDIATLTLEVKPLDPDGSRLEAALTSSTAGHSTAETLFPGRFCAWTTLDGDIASTLDARWRGHVNGRLSQGTLTFDALTRQVLRRQLERQDSLDAASQDSWPGRNSAAPGDWDEEERTTTPFPPGEVTAMDRVTMLLWLRRQTLIQGLELQPAVLNGRHLIGYRIQVEGQDDLPWRDGTRNTWRLRLDPLVNDDSKTYPVWLWIGQDDDRLPLRMRGSGALGTFELRLVDLDATPVAECPAVTL